MGIHIADVIHNIWVNIVSCISQYRGARCDHFTPEKEENHLDQLTINESKFDSCESGCESNLGRVLLFSAIGILLSLLLIFFLCSIFHICYKKRHSSKKICSSMKKSSTLKQDKPENNTSKYNQHLVNLSLPKQNYTKLSKIYLNPLFDTYITKSCLTNIKMNPTAITTHSTMSATNHQCYHHHTHQHHDNHYNPYHINTQFNSNYANDCECNYNNSIQYSTSRSIHSYHKNLSIPSIIDLITNYSTIQTTSILCNPVITYTNKSLAKESILPCQTEQHHAIDAYNTNHHLNLLTNRINNFKLISTSTELTMTTMNTMTSHSALHSNSYNLPLHDYNQSNYVTYSNVDSDIHNLSLITKLPHKNTNAAFNWNNTDHIKNIHDQLNCYHYSTFNKTNDMKHLPCNSLTWSYSNNCYHSTNTLPLLSLQNNDYYNDHYHHHQYAVHNHKHHDALQMNQYNNDSNNSVKQLDIDSLTNTSDSCYPIQSDMTT